MDYKSLCSALVLVVVIASVNAQDPCMQLKTTVATMCSTELRDLTINCNSQPSRVSQCIDKALSDNGHCMDADLKSAIKTKKDMYELYCEPSNREALNRDGQCKTVTAPSFTKPMFDALNNPPTLDCKKTKEDREMEVKKASGTCMKFLQDLLNKFDSSETCEKNKNKGDFAPVTKATTYLVVVTTLMLLSLVKLF